MKKLIGTLIGALVLILVLSSCSKKIVPVSVRDSIVSKIEYVKHDSLIYISDSAGFRAFLICDSLGNVRIREVQEYYAGQFIKPTVVIKENRIMVDCKIDSAKIAVTWYSKNSSLIQVRTVTLPGTVTNILHWWQKILIWIGGIASLLILIYAVYYFALNKFKILSMFGK